MCSPTCPLLLPRAGRRRGARASRPAKPASGSSVASVPVGAPASAERAGRWPCPKGSRSSTTATSRPREASGRARGAARVLPPFSCSGSSTSSGRSCPSTSPRAPTRALRGLGAVEDPRRALLRGAVHASRRSRRSRAPTHRPRPRLARGHHAEHGRAGAGRRGEQGRQDRARARPDPGRRAATCSSSTSRSTRRRSASARRTSSCTTASACSHPSTAKRSSGPDGHRRPRRLRVLLRPPRDAHRGAARALVAPALRPHPAGDDRRPRAAGRDAERLLGHGHRARGGDDRRSHRLRLVLQLQVPVPAARCSTGSR